MTEDQNGRKKRGIFFTSGQACPSRNLGAEAPVSFPGRWYFTPCDTLLLETAQNRVLCGFSETELSAAEARLCDTFPRLLLSWHALHPLTLISHSCESSLNSRADWRFPSTPSRPTVLTPVGQHFLALLYAGLEEVETLCLYLPAPNKGRAWAFVLCFLAKCSIWHKIFMKEVSESAHNGFERYFQSSGW